MAAAGPRDSMSSPTSSTTFPDQTNGSSLSSRARYESRLIAGEAVAIVLMGVESGRPDLVRFLAIVNPSTHPDFRSAFRKSPRPVLAPDRQPLPLWRSCLR